MTAEALMAQLAHNDEYQKFIRREDEEIAAVAAEMRDAERPIVTDLRAAGLKLDSVSDLLDQSPRANANEVLIRHLDRGGYPDEIMDDMARAMRVEEKPPYDWWYFKARFLRASCTAESTGLAVLLAGSAQKKHLEGLVDLLRETDSEDRVFFLPPLRRLGGDHELKIIRALRADPVLGEEATEQLRQAERLERRRQKRST